MRRDIDAMPAVELRQVEAAWVQADQVAARDAAQRAERPKPGLVGGR